MFESDARIMRENTPKSWPSSTAMAFRPVSRISFKAARPDGPAPTTNIDGCAFIVKISNVPNLTLVTL